LEENEGGQKRGVERAQMLRSRAIHATVFDNDNRPFDVDVEIFVTAFMTQANYNFQHAAYGPLFIV
jgi:hypothetical protein